MVKSSIISTDNTLRDATVKSKENQSRISCYNCNMLDHIARNCKADKKEKSDDKWLKIRIAKVSGDDQGNGFIMDSGAFQHVFKDMSNLFSFEDIGPVTVHLADDKSVSNRQQELVLLNMCIQRKGCKRTTSVLVTIVLYTPEAVVNILLCSQLGKIRISTKIDNGNCVLLDRRDKNRVIGNAPSLRCEGLYKLDSKVQHGGTSGLVTRAKIMKRARSSTGASLLVTCA